MLSRSFHAKNNKETIAAWGSDLIRILHVFNVRSATSSWTSLTVCLQIELAINTHVAVSDIRKDVSDTHIVVSDIHRCVGNTNDTLSELRHDVANAHAIISDIHRNVLQSQEGGQRQSVSGTYAQSITK